MDEKTEPRIKKPVGAVLSVRVPRDLAAAVDDYAREHSMSLSEFVRVALESYLSPPLLRIHPTLYASAAEASISLNSPAAGVHSQTRGRTPTETVREWDPRVPLTLAV